MKIHEVPVVDDALLSELKKAKKKLSLDKIDKILTRIRQVIRKKGTLCYVRPGDPLRTSIVRNPVWAGPAEGLKEIGQVLTLHGYGKNCMQFEPTLAEVLSMIPDDMLGKCKAFEIHGPRNEEDFARQACAIVDGYHVAVVTLYA